MSTMSSNLASPDLLMNNNQNASTPVVLNEGKELNNLIKLERLLYRIVPIVISKKPKELKMGQELEKYYLKIQKVKLC